MKNQLNLISRWTFSAVAAAALSLSNHAFAQAAQATPERPNGTSSMVGVGQKPSKKEQAAAASPSANAKGTSMQLDSSDKNFMMEAAKGGMMEVEMGKMAQTQGQSAEVKNIGKTMVADHSNANNQLMSIASKKGVKLDSKMEKMEGSNFDQEYLDAMVKDDEKDIAAFEREAKSGMDPDVKSFASKTLPTLKKLAMVKSAQSKTAKKSG